MTHHSQPLVLISQFLTIFKQSFKESKQMKLMLSTIPDCVRKYGIIVLINMMKFDELT